jgi:hypothetical protein
MSVRFYRNPMGTRLCGQSALSDSLRRGAPERSPRGPAKRGSGSGGDASTAPQYCWGAGIPLRDRIFLRKKLLRPTRSHHSRRRLSRIPSRKATVAPAETCSGLPKCAKWGDARSIDGLTRTRFLRKRLLRLWRRVGMWSGCLRSGNRRQRGMQETVPGYYHRRFSRIPSRRAAAAPAEIYSALPKTLLVRLKLSAPRTGTFR